MPVVPGDPVFVQNVMPQGQGIENNINRATPDAFGAGIGQALEQGGNMLAQVAVQRQQLANEANVNDVYANQFSPAARNILQNYMQLEGKDAEAAFPDYQQQMQDLRTQTRASLPNAMQQKAFDQIGTRRIESDLNGMARYAAAQTKQWEWNSHTAKIADFINEAEANCNNYDHLRGVAAQVDAETIIYGKNHGWSNDVIDYQVGENNDKLNSAVIKRQAQSGDVTGAMGTYRNAVAANRLSGSAQGELDKFFKPIQDLQAAQNACGNVTGGATAQQIASEAQKQGVDPSTALTVWSAEGAAGLPANMDDQTFAPTSGGGGIASGAEDGLPVALNDRPPWQPVPPAQVQLGVALTKQNTAALYKDLGRQPQPWEVYLAHQQGIDGAKALLHADPDANAGDVVGNPNAITSNGGAPDMSAGQFLNYIKGYVDRNSQMYASNGVPTAQNLAAKLRCAHSGPKRSGAKGLSERSQDAADLHHAL